MQEGIHRLYQFVSGAQGPKSLRIFVQKECLTQHTHSNMQLTHASLVVLLANPNKPLEDSISSGVRKILEIHVALVMGVFP